jgi:hypothetical protein
MKCPHLMKWSILSCKAFAKYYVPSLFELEVYCRTKDHGKCPLYRGYAAGMQTTEDAVSA